MPARIATELIEVLTIPPAGNAYVSQALIEVLVAAPTRDPTTITGAGVTQHLVEVLVRPDSPAVRVSNEVVEVLVRPADVAGGGSGGAVTRGWVTF